MRRFKKGTVLKVRAIAGLHVVVLAWDFTKKLTVTGAALPAELEDLLGFAIEREERDDQGQVVEKYMLRGIKRFRLKDQGILPGTPMPLDEHPVQTFQWADYTVKPATTYTYRVIPMRGTSKNLAQGSGSVKVVVTTEPEVDLEHPGDLPRHDIFFNRGVIGSQAYARRFENDDPDPAEPGSPPMKWLSRGLYEALLAFIAEAEDPHYALRAAFYEFRYPPIARAFRRAVEAGADVKIVYDADSDYEIENVQTLADAQLLQPDIQIPRTVSEGLRHNKFVVLLKDGDPVAVWTGSTNISPGGIFGHSNVGHVVWDEDVAGAYLEYWQRLADNLTPTQLRPLNRAASPTPAGKIPKKSVVPFFSARDPADGIETLQWYAARMSEATRMVCLTVAFNLDSLFRAVLFPESDVLRYIVKDDNLDDSETVGMDDHDILFAAGGRLDAGALANFLGERGNPLNSNDYIHTKFMLVDPLGKDPLVVTGSANFSRPSQSKNDENMLAIRGDTRVADIYFGEFMRIFDHHYTRYVVRLLQDAGKSDPAAGYLKEEAKDWVRPHFDSDSYKSKRRKYYTET
jgi:phosphatidylserine/phosphatidylglycerophosphate/cardiolipin synthase-like enzyme